MKKSFVNLCLFAAAACAAAVPGYAQSSQMLMVKVPFDFTVGKVSLPAGSYSVSWIGSIQTHLQLTNKDGKEGVIERINPVGLNPGQVSEATKLIFHRYGDQYFLAQFWNLGSETGYELPRSKAEREIGRHVAQPKTEILPAGQ